VSAKQQKYSAFQSTLWTLLPWAYSCKSKY